MKINNLLSKFKAGFLAVLLAVTGSVALTSCSDDDDGPEDGAIWDIAPITLQIRLVDAEGNNLLDPKVPGNWYGTEMWMENNGKRYEIKWLDPDDLPKNGFAPFFVTPSENSRAILAEFYGFYMNTLERTLGGTPVGVDSWPDLATTVLEWGNYDGMKNIHEYMIFGISELNQTYKLDMYHEFHWKDHQPASTTWIKCDGKFHDYEPLVLVLPKRETKE